MSQRIIIVGGGIIGMLTARELHASGNQVTLIERGLPGQESTWAGGGIISPLFPWRYLDSITRLAAWSQSHYAEVCEALHTDTGIDPEYTSSGMLMVASEEIDNAIAWAKQHQRDLRLIDQAEFGQLEPAAAHPPAQGLWMPHVGQVRNPRIAKALHADLARRNIAIMPHTPVDELVCRNNRCTGVRIGTQHIESDQVVVCAGAWSAQLLNGFSAPPSVRPIRGQMILFKTTPGTIQRITLEEQRYIIPRRDGHVLFGSSMEDVGFDKSTTSELYRELYDIVIERFPVLRQFPVVKHWAGLRPSSPAGVPYISAHPEIQGLLINAGQFRNGVVLGVASARLMADLVNQRQPIVDPSAYHWTAARG